MSPMRSAAHGTIAMVVSRGAYFVLGYIVAVVLARGLGPVPYGSYGVIMAVLVWLEQSARHAVPAAVAKLVAERPESSPTLQWSALGLNLPLHLLLFAVLWIAAPWLGRWLHVDDGAWLFRIAALDLPLYAVYATLQAIHQGQRDFIRISLVEIAYMATKVVGVLLLVAAGMSVFGALLVNLASSVVAALLLLPGTGPWLRRPDLAMVRPLAVLATPIGFFFLCQLLASNLDVLTLGYLLPESEAAVVGIYVAAMNIARVPGVALAAVTAVLLPAVARALAEGDAPLTLRYIQQALRFFALLYLPAYFVIGADAESLMQLLYSNQFAGGGTILRVLLLAHGLWAVHAIFSFVLVATGEVGKLAIAMALSLPPSLLLFVGLIEVWQGVGAAVANVIVPALVSCLFFVLIKTRLGQFLPLRSLALIAVAGLLMLATGAAIGSDGGMVFVSCPLGLLVYGAALWALGEVRREDLERLLPGRRSEEMTG
jgi:O-antigen/teichoic acid export membrane protein